MTQKLVGHHNDIPVYEDPDAPSGTLYFMHEHWLNDHCRPTYVCWKNNSLGFRIKYRIKRLLCLN